MIDTTSLIGLTAAACTTLSFVPQVIHILRSRNTSGISLGMYLIFTVGVALWAIYGLIRDDLPVLLANGLTLLLTLSVLILTLRGRFYDRHHPQPKVADKLD